MTILWIVFWFFAWPFAAFLGAVSLILDGASDRSFLQLIKCFFLGILLGILMIICMIYLTVIWSIVDNIFSADLLMQRWLDAPEFTLDVFGLFSIPGFTKYLKITLYYIPLGTIVAAWLFGIISSVVVRKQNARAKSVENYQQLSQKFSDVYKSRGQLYQNLNEIKSLVTGSYYGSSVVESTKRLLKQGISLEKELDERIQLRHLDFEEENK